MKEGQIYEYEGKERFVLTNISSKRLCAIYQSGIVINLERFSPQMKVYGKLIAEYPIWQQAVIYDFKGWKSESDEDYPEEMEDE